MADDLKTRSFRISEDTADRFKQLCISFGNQNSALDALISTYEMQQAKTMITERQTDIDNFDAHLQALQKSFLHSLEITEDTTERVRAEFQRQLESKDSTICDLQERIRQVEAEMNASKEQVRTATNEADTRIEQATKEIDDLKKEVISLTGQASELGESLTSAKSQIADKQQIIDNLNQKLTDTEIMTGKVESAEARAVQAEKELSTVKSELSETKKLHEAEVKELRQQLASQTATAEQSAKVAEKIAEADKREALANQKEKYIEELDKLRQEIKILTEENFNLKTQLSMQVNKKD
ncbi:MAG: hypothetical protein K2G36_10740 [Ruminococcus sp.]|nr:hypothetical protein [Ruminococcus sp.]